MNGIQMQIMMLLFTMNPTTMKMAIGQCKNGINIDENFTNVDQMLLFYFSI